MSADLIAWGTLVAAIIFGASTVFAARLGGYQIPSQIIFMIPPAMTILALVLFNIQQQRRSQSRIMRAAKVLRTEAGAKGSPT